MLRLIRWLDIAVKIARLSAFWSCWNWTVTHESQHHNLQRHGRIRHVVLNLMLRHVPADISNIAEAPSEEQKKLLLLLNPPLGSNAGGFNDFERFKVLHPRILRRCHTRF